MHRTGQGAPSSGIKHLALGTFSLSEGGGYSLMGSKQWAVGSGQWIQAKVSVICQWRLRRLGILETMVLVQHLVLCSHERYALRASRGVCALVEWMCLTVVQC